MGEQPVLDPEVMGRLGEWGGPALIAKLVDLFLENTPAKIDEIRVGVASDEAHLVERAAHSLKSSAGNLGATRLHYLAAELEETAALGSADALGDLAARLEAAHAETCDALKALQLEAPES
jgi:HPt (histidine-containing phosphotransfer) domain-containing protein